MRKPKLKSPSLKIEKPKGVACKPCHGSGAIRGAMYQMVCGECGGLGIEHGEPFDNLEDALARALIATRRELSEAKRINRELSNQRIGSRFD